MFIALSFEHWNGFVHTCRSPCTALIKLRQKALETYTTVNTDILRTVTFSLWLCLPVDGVTGDICPVGEFCLEGSDTGTPCPPGTYMNHTGASSCYTCPQGHFCTGGANVEPCPQGFYCPAGTDSGYLPCPVGKIFGFRVSWETKHIFMKTLFIQTWSNRSPLLQVLPVIYTGIWRWLVLKPMESYWYQVIL